MEGNFIGLMFIFATVLPIVCQEGQPCNIHCTGNPRCLFRIGCRITYHTRTFECAGPNCTLLLQTNFTSFLDEDNVTTILDESQIELCFPFDNNQTKLGNLHYHFIATDDKRQIYLKKYDFIFAIESAVPENSGDYKLRFIDNYNSLEILQESYNARFVEFPKRPPVCKSERLQSRTFRHSSFLLTCTVKSGIPTIKVNILSPSRCIILESRSSSVSMPSVSAFVPNCNDTSNFTCVAESTIISTLPDEHYKESCMFYIAANDNTTLDDSRTTNVTPGFFKIFSDPLVTFAIICYVGGCSILYAIVKCFKKRRVKHVLNVPSGENGRNFENINIGDDGIEDTQGAVGYQALVLGDNKAYFDRIYDDPC